MIKRYFFGSIFLFFILPAFGGVNEDCASARLLPEKLVDDKQEFLVFFSETSNLTESESILADGKNASDRRRGSEASRRSRSRAHINPPASSGRKPASQSVKPGSIDSDRQTPTPSSVDQTRGRRRQPLNLTERDRYFGVGSREIGFNFGTAHSITDIQGTKGMGFNESLGFQIRNPGITAGVYSRLRMVEWFGLSVGFDFARLSGTDTGNLTGFEAYSFENNILEFNARLVFFAPLATKNFFDVYGFAGLGLFVNNLLLKDPSGFETQVLGDFKLLQPAIPMGVGLSWVVGHRVVLGYELGYRYTSFNLLDGVAPVDTHYDAYFFNTLRVGIILKPSRD